MRRVLVLVVAVLFLTGCTIKFFYNQLDWFVPFYASIYLDLNSKQEDFFSEQFDQQLLWHRKTQLPAYADFLERVSRDVSKGLTTETIIYIHHTARGFMTVLVNQLAPDIVDLFYQFDDKQLARLYGKLDEDSEEFNQKYILAPPKDLRERQVEKTRQYVEFWTGSLNPDQIKVIEQWGERTILMGPEFHEMQTRWLQEFRRVMTLRANRSEYKKAFLALLENREFGRSKAFKEKYERNQVLLRAFYLEMDRSLTEKQRSRALGKIGYYAKSFRTLASE